MILKCFLRNGGKNEEMSGRFSPCCVKLIHMDNHFLYSFLWWGTADAEIKISANKPQLSQVSALKGTSILRIRSVLEVLS